MIRTISFCFLLFTVVACSAQNFPKSLKDIQTAGSGLSSGEVEDGLRAALEKGVKKAADEVSQEGGYLNDPQIKIPFPPEMQKVETRLRDMGMDNQVDEFIATMNHGAEEAANEAKPIFIDAIKQMTIQDASSILRGSDNEATQYLARTTSDQLHAKFLPVIRAALEKTGATNHYNTLVSTYNKIPFVQKVNPDLDEYATELAIEGLFVKIAEEERKIRQDPAARTTDLLRKVFGQNN